MLNFVLYNLNLDLNDLWSGALRSMIKEACGMVISDIILLTSPCKGHELSSHSKGK